MGKANGQDISKIAQCNKGGETPGASAVAKDVAEK